MEKRIKIMYLILILIIILSVVGFAIYNANHVDTLNTEFQENLNTAHGYYQDRLIKMNESATALPSTIRLNNNYDAQQMKDVMAIDKQAEDLLKKEIDSLNKAKEYATTKTQKEYLSLLIESRENNQKYFDTLAKLMETNLKFAQGNITLAEQTSSINQYSDELAIIQNDTSKIEKIGTFLAANPDFKQQLVDLNLKIEYLGETS